jgi:preprotein translocase subunit SecG
MLTFILILSVLVAVLLIAVVLVQNPKGSGLASNFSGGNQFFGVKKTTEFVEKATWVLAGLVLLISLFAASYNPKGSAPSQNAAAPTGQVDEELEKALPKNSAPMAPASGNNMQTSPTPSAEPSQPQPEAAQ